MSALAAPNQTVVLRQAWHYIAWQLGALRDALLNAGATAEKADRAAEELAGYETRIASIDSRLPVLTWMVGFNLVLTAGVLWRLLAH